MRIRKEIIEIKNKIAKEFKPQKIILFGSYAQGHQKKDSDIDLLIIKETKLPKHKRAKEIRKILRGYLIPIDIIVYTPKEVEEWKNANTSFIASIMKNGKVIYG